MVSCEQREAVRTQTLAGFAETDWSEALSVVMDESRQEVTWRRVEETFLRALSAFIDDDDAQFALLLEDDVDLNLSLRHNLERWPPLMAAAEWPAAPFMGSLFHAGQPLLWQDGTRRAKVAAPEGFWGAQALVISRATARHVLARWEPGRSPHDMQLPLLAAEVSPVYFHTPSLAQQRDVPSTWGPGNHRAIDYDPRFVAPELPRRRHPHGLTDR
jgi:hypothetical protein